MFANDLRGQLGHHVPPPLQVSFPSFVMSSFSGVFNFQSRSEWGTNDTERRLKAQGNPPAELLRCVYMPVPAHVTVIAAPVHTVLMPDPAPAPPAAPHVRVPKASLSV